MHRLKRDFLLRSSVAGLALVVIPACTTTLIDAEKLDLTTTGRQSDEQVAVIRGHRDFWLRTNWCSVAPLDQRQRQDIIELRVDPGPITVYVTCDKNSYFTNLQKSGIFQVDAKAGHVYKAKYSAFVTKACVQMWDVTEHVLIKEVCL